MLESCYYVRFILSLQGCYDVLYLVDSLPSLPLLVSSTFDDRKKFQKITLGLFLAGMLHPLYWYVYYYLIVCYITYSVAISTRSFNSRISLLNFCAVLGAAIYFPVKETFDNKLPPASAVTLLLEQIRLLMKTHAFVRSNIPVSLAFCTQRRAGQKKIENVADDDDQALCPDFSKYLYFMFAPTLVYRNRYPRFYHFDI